MIKYIESYLSVQKESVRTILKIEAEKIEDKRDLSKFKGLWDIKQLYNCKILDVIYVEKNWLKKNDISIIYNYIRIHPNLTSPEGSFIELDEVPRDYPNIFVKMKDEFSNLKN